MKTPEGNRLADNRKAHFDYETLEKFEGGIVLTGQETKSIREGGAKLDGAHLAISRGELWLIGAHVRPYSKIGKIESYDPYHSRKILVHKKELQYLFGKISEKGLTLVPFSLYSAGRRIKLSFGLCRGRKTHDKKEKLKARDLDKEVQRHMRGRDLD